MAYNRQRPKTGKLYTSDGEVFDRASFLKRVDGAMSSFDEVSTVQPSNIIDLKSVYPLSKLRDRVIAENGGDVTQVDGEFEVSTTDNVNSSVIFESVESGRYIAGYDAIPGMGVRLPNRPVGNQFVEFGYTDFQDGYVVGEDSNGVYTAIYKGGQKTVKKYREEWLDPLDDEPFVYDPAEFNIYRINFRWYGRGPFKLRIAGEDEYDRGVLYTADVLKADTSDGLATNNANLPLSIKIDNAGEGNPLAAYVGGRQFFVLGDYNPTKRIIGSWRLDQSVGEDFTPLIAFRQKGGLYQPMSVKLAGVDILSADNLLWRLTTFSNVTNGDWVDPQLTDNGNESACEFNTTGTTLDDSESIQIYPAGLVPGGQGGSAGVDTENLPALDVPSQGEVTCLSARSISGTTTVSSVLKVREEW